jgi:hypothetical protein
VDLPAEGIDVGVVIFSVDDEPVGIAFDPDPPPGLFATDGE